MGLPPGVGLRPGREETLADGEGPERGCAGGGAGPARALMSWRHITASEV